VKFMFQVRSAGKAEGTMTRLRSDTLPGKTTFRHLTSGLYDPVAVEQVLPLAGQPVLNADGSLLLPGAPQALSADIVATFKEAPALIVIVFGSPQVVYLKQGIRITFGRDKSCNVVLADAAASRRHAEVFPGPDGFYIRDFGSANGVIVNQMKIDNPYLLVHGDRIEIGGTVIFFMNILQEERAAAVVEVGQRVPVQGHNSASLSEVKDSLNAPCRNCGASNISIARFCATCGTPLENPHAVINS
jgi:pSer/pThr/pTyr-binding forkhead associated (FHA) protein